MEHFVIITDILSQKQTTIFLFEQARTQDFERSGGFFPQRGKPRLSWDL